METETDRIHKDFSKSLKGLVEKISESQRKANLILSKKSVGKLDRQEIIQTLRKRHEAGLTLKCTEVCLENRDLATAAINAFSSWGRALAAAGLGVRKDRVCRKPGCSG